MNCKLCCEEVPLIDAHIIPRPFFARHGTKGASRDRLLSNSRGVRPKRLPTGFYDKQILCAKCDHGIGVWDQYAVELLLQRIDSFDPLAGSGEIVAFFRPEVDYVKLKLFFLSVLWRAHHSSQAVFSRVQLGPYERRIHQMISKSDAGPSTDFDVVLSVFTLNGKISDLRIPIMDPHRERWNGVNAYRLSFGAITAYIKVDKFSLPNSFSEMALAPGRPLYLIERDFHSSPEMAAVRSVVRAPQNRSLFRQNGSPRGDV